MNNSFKNCLQLLLSTTLIASTSALIYNYTNINRNQTKINDSINTLVTAKETQKDQFLLNSNIKSFYQTSNNQNLTLKKATNDSGETAFEVYYPLDKIWLSHNNTQSIGGAVGAGIGAVIALLNVFFPGVGTAVIGAVAAILIAQWYIWNVPGSDNGSGVIIKMWAPTVIPTWIVDAYGQ